MERQASDGWSRLGHNEAPVYLSTRPHQIILPFATLCIILEFNPLTVDMCFQDITTRDIYLGYGII